MSIYTWRIPNSPVLSIHPSRLMLLVCYSILLRRRVVKLVDLKKKKISNGILCSMYTVFARLNDALLRETPVRLIYKD